MNYKSFDRQELENLAHARFGNVLRLKIMSEKDIIEELKFYDRFIKFKKGGKFGEELPDY